MRITGSWLGSYRRIVEGSTSRGSTVRSSFSRMSWVMSFIGVFQLNSRMTSLRPARLTDRMFTRLLRTARAPSMRRVIRSSTSAGAAPGYSVRTVTVG